jgi:hypothetical protein
MRRVPVSAPDSNRSEDERREASPAAVVVMAKQPIAGRVKTRLTPPLTPEEAAGLSHSFLLDKLDQVRRMRDVARYLAFAPPEAEAAFAPLARLDFTLVSQVGADLGERLAGLVMRVCARRVSAVGIVGTDSPTLPDDFLAEAVGVLHQRRADVVIGPAEDGGYYLIGLRNPSPSLFRGISWSTSDVLRETLARVRTAGLRLHLLPAWFDVDTETDLRRLARDMDLADIMACHTRAHLRTLRPL